MRAPNSCKPVSNLTAAPTSPPPLMRSPVICAPTTAPFGGADCWLAAQNLMLAACAESLGTCVIGFALSALNQADVKAELGIPPDMSAVAPIIVGTPRGETPATTRRAPRILGFV